MSDRQLRETVSRLLRQSHSHAGLRRALEGFPVELAGQRAGGHRHTAWQQVEHLRLAAEDLVSYCRDQDYQELGWPQGYWPKNAAPASGKEWFESVERLLQATEAMASMVESAEIDLYAPVPSTEKEHHHILRAALILLDHNGYHAGQLIALRQALRIWPPN